jgi:acetyltransferase
MSAARGAARNKPVLALRTGGRSRASRVATTQAGQSLTRDQIYDAVLHRAGVVRVQSLDDLFDALEVIEHGHSVPASGSRSCPTAPASGDWRPTCCSPAAGASPTSAPPRANASRRSCPACVQAARSSCRATPRRQTYRSVVEAVAQAAGVDAVLVVHAPRRLVVRHGGGGGRLRGRGKGRAGGLHLLAGW